MIESLGKLLLDPLAGRWKGAAIGGSLVFWLFLGCLVLFTRKAPDAAGTWPVGCRPRAGHGRPLWCAATAGNNLTVVVVIAIASAVIGTAFLTKALAPSVLNLAQAGGWNRWPLVPVLPRLPHNLLRRFRSRKYPTAVFAGGLQPTRVGNRFAALSERMDRRFGFEVSVVWDVLISSLPQEARAKFAEKTQTLLLACQHIVLGVAATTSGLILLPGGWCKVVVTAAAFTITVVMWRGLAATADEYCDLVITTLVLHHGVLYTALGETPPAPGEDLRLRGQMLNRRIRDIVR